MREILKMGSGMDMELQRIVMEKCTMESGDVEDAMVGAFCILQNLKFSMGSGWPTRSMVLVCTTGLMGRLIFRGMRTMFDWNLCGGREIVGVHVS